MVTSANGELARMSGAAQQRIGTKKSEQESSNQNKARQVKGKKIPHFAKGVATTWRPGWRGRREPQAAGAAAGQRLATRAPNRPATRPGRGACR